MGHDNDDKRPSQLIARLSPVVARLRARWEATRELVVRSKLATCQRAFHEFDDPVYLYEALAWCDEHGLELPAWSQNALKTYGTDVIKLDPDQTTSNRLLEAVGLGSRGNQTALKYHRAIRQRVEVVAWVAEQMEEGLADGKLRTVAEYFEEAAEKFDLTTELGDSADSRVREWFYDPRLRDQIPTHLRRELDKRSK